MQVLLRGANGGLRWALGDKMRAEDAARGACGPGWRELAGTFG